MRYDSSNIFDALRIATKPYAHKTGSQTGMSPNRVFLWKVSTPVLMKSDSDAVMTRSQKTKKTQSFESYFTKNERAIIPTYAVRRIQSFEMTGIKSTIATIGTQLRATFRI